jgi:tetratricopeptide (TPR) repeat protein
MVNADYLAPLLGVEIPYGAAMALAGEMQAGVSWIEDSIERFRKWGNKSQPAFGHLVLGEIYLQMALGKNKPPLGVMIRNLGFILPNLPFAARKARQHLERAVRECREIDVPANLARGLWDLALLYRFQKRTDEARACLIKASVIAKPQAPALHARITHELQHLPIEQGRSP